MADMDWTVMIYMAADNDLDENGEIDIKKLKTAMIKAGGSKRVSVLVQYDRRGEQTTKRFEITSNGAVKDFLKDIVEEVPEVGTGDPEELIKFLNWGIKFRPAHHYLVSLWGHGFGVDDEGDENRSEIRTSASRIVRPPLFNKTVTNRLERLREAVNVDQLLNNISEASPLRDEDVSMDIFGGLVSIESILPDETNKGFLSNVEMKYAFERVASDLGRKLDIVMMDACNMSMVEVGYQLKNSAEIMLASEETTPVQGWPYDTILSRLIANPSIPTDTLASFMVHDYIASYEDDDVTQAASDLKIIDGLKMAVDKLANALLNNLLRPGFLDDLRVSLYYVQKYYIDGSFVDLYDFCHLLSKRTNITEVDDACVAVKNIIDSNFIIASGKKGSSVRFSHGTAIYLPKESLKPLYASLDFVKQTRWGKFLEAYLQKTERTD